MADGQQTIDWEQRCMNAEKQLEKFKLQALKVRDAVSTKIKVLEDKTSEAESKANDAHTKLSKAERIAKHAVEKIRTLEHVVVQKDELNVKKDVLLDEQEGKVNKIKEEMELQKKKRIEDSQRVEQKATQIKEWVTIKLAEFQQENERLHSEYEEAQRTIKQLQAIKSQGKEVLVGDEIQTTDDAVDNLTPPFSPQDRSQSSCSTDTEQGSSMHGSQTMPHELDFEHEHTYAVLEDPDDNQSNMSMASLAKNEELLICEETQPIADSAALVDDSNHSWTVNVKLYPTLDGKGYTLLSQETTPTADIYSIATCPTATDLDPSSPFYVPLPSTSSGESSSTQASVISGGTGDGHNVGLGRVETLYSGSCDSHQDLPLVSSGGEILAFADKNVSLYVEAGIHATSSGYNNIPEPSFPVEPKSKPKEKPKTKTRATSPSKIPRYVGLHKTKTLDSSSHYTPLSPTRKDFEESVKSYQPQLKQIEDLAVKSETCVVEAKEQKCNSPTSFSKIPVAESEENRHSHSTVPSFAELSNQLLENGFKTSRTSNGLKTTNLNVCPNLVHNDLSEKTNSRSEDLITPKPPKPSKPPPSLPLQLTSSEESLKAYISSDEELIEPRHFGNFTSYVSQEELASHMPPSPTLPDLESASALFHEIQNNDLEDFVSQQQFQKRPNHLDLEMLEERTVPVYATVKGRASQIRTTPFTGDSTDSSDDESDNLKHNSGAGLAVQLQPEQVADDAVKKKLEKPKQVILKTCAAYTTQSLQNEVLDKSGYLTKLGGRIKNWKKRWFVLKDSKLFYFKSQSDRKPLGEIPLDGFCRITRTESEGTFEIATSKRTYYLTAENSVTAGEWLTVLHKVMRKFTTSPLLAQVGEKEHMKGWMTKVKHGNPKRCWAVLRGQNLFFFKHDTDQCPFNILNMKGLEFDELDVHDSDEEDDDSPCNYTLMTILDKQPLYILIGSRQDKDAWLYHLSMASGSSRGSLGTESEKLIAKLMEVDGSSDSCLWNNTTLVHTKEAIMRPLTTLPTGELENQAIQLFKAIQLFCSAEIQELAIDYHITLAQNALQTCLDHPELRNEIYCQLIRQTSKLFHRHRESGMDGLQKILAGKSSWQFADTFSIASDATIDFQPVPHHVYEQGWMLLALCCTLFLPKQKFFWYLRLHLQRYANKETEIGTYALFCERCIQRTLQNGEREAKPARMEALSVLLRNPYHHSYPASIPVHFPNGSYQVFGFDGSTTVQEFTDNVNKELNIRDTAKSGFALHTDNPTHNTEHCLQASVKLCDVISKWEQANRTTNQGKVEPSRVIKFIYKNRLYFKSLANAETEQEKLFLVYQTCENVLSGMLPVKRDLAVHLASLLLQIEYGGYSSSNDKEKNKKVLEKGFERFFPKHLVSGEDEKRQVISKIGEKWFALNDRAAQECVRIYLNIARKWPFFGATLFQCKFRRVQFNKRRDSASEKQESVWLAVEEDGVCILNSATLELKQEFKYKSVVTFGGWKDDFMLVVNRMIERDGVQQEEGTERLLFIMPRQKILETTLLIASYINAIVRQQGLTCELPTDRRAVRGRDQGVKVWDMESAEWPMVPDSGVGLL